MVSDSCSCGRAGRQRRPRDWFHRVTHSAAADLLHRCVPSAVTLHRVLNYRQWFPYRWTKCEHSGLFSGSKSEKDWRLWEALTTATCPLHCLLQHHQPAFECVPAGQKRRKPANCFAYPVTRSLPLLCPRPCRAPGSAEQGLTTHENTRLNTSKHRQACLFHSSTITEYLISKLMWYILGKGKYFCCGRALRPLTSASRTLLHVYKQGPEKKTVLNNRNFSTYTGTTAPNPLLHVFPGTIPSSAQLLRLCCTSCGEAC